MNRYNTSSKTAISTITRFKWWLLTALAVGAGVAVVAQPAPAALPSPTNGVEMSSQVTNAANGNTTLNSTNSVGSGDTVQWMAKLRYQLSTPGSSEGVMTLPAGFTWERGSMAIPSSVTPKWNTGTVASKQWTTTEPATGTPVAEFGWMIAAFTEIRSTPAVGNTVGFQGTGDGYRVITYANTRSGFEKNNLYVVNHHTFTSYLNCRKAEDGTVCPGFETGGKTIPVANDTHVDLPQTSSELRYTPGRSIEHLNSTTGELFIYTSSNLGNIRVQCVNLDTLKSCITDTIVDQSTIRTFEAINILGSVGTKYYAQSLAGIDPNNSNTVQTKILCFDTATKTPCAGYPVVLPRNLATPREPFYSMANIVGTRIYHIADDQMRCFDTVARQACQDLGWRFAPPVVSASTLQTVLNPQGTVIGHCGISQCKYLNGTNFLPSDIHPNYAAFNASHQGYYTFTLQEGRGVHTMTHGTRVFQPRSKDAFNYTDCYDFRTNDTCPNFPISSTDGQSRTYSIVKDTVRVKTRSGSSDCFWTLGDAANARSFNPETGLECLKGNPVARNIELEINPQINSQCDPTAVALTKWGKIRFSPTLTWGGGKLEGMDVEIYKSKADFITNPGVGMIPGTPSEFVYGEFELDISSISVATYKSLYVVLTPRVGLNASQISGAVGYDVTYDGAPLQLCFKTKAPTVPLCSAISANTVVQTVPSHTPNATPETLKDQTSADANKPQDGAGPNATTTTLLQYPRGSSDPTQVMQTKFNLGTFSGDLWQYDLLSDYSVSPAPISKATAATAPAASDSYMVGATGGLASVSWVNLSPTQQTSLNQKPGGTVDTNGSARLNYVMGNRSNEGTLFRSRTAGLFGPAVNSSPTVLAKAPLAGRSDGLYANYNAYKTNVLRSEKAVFFTSNDGFLHAYSVRSTGLQPAFRYLPSFVVKDLPRYSDSTMQQIRLNPYLIDSTPMVADVNLAVDNTKLTSTTYSATSNLWRTAVVANQGRGGSGVFALDVTSNQSVVKPASVLFEYSKDTPVSGAEATRPLADLGYQLGQPPSDTVMGANQIVRVRSQNSTASDPKDKSRWAYVTGNGANLQDGQPNSQLGRAVLYLFYMNANTAGGASLPRWTRIAVNGDAKDAAGKPVYDAELDFGNGLSTPRPVDIDGDGVVDLIYAGDQKGNLWRFDVRDMTVDTNGNAKNVVVTRLFKGSADKPIFTAPAVQLDSGNTACINTTGASTWSRAQCWMVMFATGQAVTAVQTIIPSTTLQTAYGILDRGETSTAGLVDAANLIAQTINSTVIAGPAGSNLTYRSVSSNAVSYTGNTRGWYFNFPANEHNTANPLRRSNSTVIFGSVAPITTLPCSVSWQTQVSVKEGSSKDGSGAAINIDINGKGPSVSQTGVLNIGGLSPMGGTTVNATKSTLLGNKTNTFGQNVNTMVGRLSWREVFGAPKD